jgi:hypothetical protein
VQAWLASRGPLLQQLAVQRHLWGEVAAAVQPADTASPLHAGMVESAFESAASASQQAWQGVMQELFALYRAKLRQADAQGGAAPWGASAGGDNGHAEGAGSGSGAGNDRAGAVRAPPGPDLMHIGFSRLQALLVVVGGSEAARRAARWQLAACDPPSTRLLMAKVGWVAGKNGWFCGG